MYFALGAILTALGVTCPIAVALIGLGVGVAFEVVSLMRARAEGQGPNGLGAFVFNVAKGGAMTALGLEVRRRTSVDLLTSCSDTDLLTLCSDTDPHPRHHSCVATPLQPHSVPARCFPMVPMRWWGCSIFCAAPDGTHTAPCTSRRSEVVQEYRQTSPWPQHTGGPVCARRSVPWGHSQALTEACSF